MDQQPSIVEISNHTRTPKWYQLGVLLELDAVDLANCRDCTRMYQVWIEKEAENATRRKLLTALRAIRQNDVAEHYEEYLKTLDALLSTQSKLYVLLKRNFGKNVQYIASRGKSSLWLILRNISTYYGCADG